MDPELLSLLSLTTGLVGVASAAFSLIASLRTKARLRKDLELHYDELRRHFASLEREVSGVPVEQQDERFDEVYRQMLLESVARLEPSEQSAILKSIKRLSEPEKADYLRDLLASVSKKHVVVR